MSKIKYNKTGGIGKIMMKINNQKAVFILSAVYA